MSCGMCLLYVRVSVIKQGCLCPVTVIALKSAAGGAASASVLQSGDLYSCDGLRKAAVTLPCETSNSGKECLHLSAIYRSSCSSRCVSSVKYFGVWWGVSPDWPFGSSGRNGFCMGRQERVVLLPAASRGSCGDVVITNRAGKRGGEECYRKNTLESLYSSKHGLHM